MRSAKGRLQRFQRFVAFIYVHQVRDRNIVWSSDFPIVLFLGIVRVIVVVVVVDSSSSSSFAAAATARNVLPDENDDDPRRTTPCSWPPDISIVVRPATLLSLSFSRNRQTREKVAALFVVVVVVLAANSFQKTLSLNGLEKALFFEDKDHNEEEKHTEDCVFQFSLGFFSKKHHHIRVLFLEVEQESKNRILSKCSQKERATKFKRTPKKKEIKLKKKKDIGTFFSYREVRNGRAFLLCRRRPRIIIHSAERQQRRKDDDGGRTGALVRVRFDFFLSLSLSLCRKARATMTTTTCRRRRQRRILDDSF